ncbi:hypothetical protein DFH09DRAFT_1300274 [Mycena vulgaris]|nr:hypothetical protein DFH09DRAFT_1300274 [Mycena vulgaris]
MSPFEHDCVRVLDTLVASRARSSISVSSPLARPYTSGPARHHSTSPLHPLLFVVCPSLRHLSPPTPAPSLIRFVLLRRVLLSLLRMNAHPANDSMRRRLYTHLVFLVDAPCAADAPLAGAGPGARSYLPHNPAPLSRSTECARRPAYMRAFGFPLLDIATAQGVLFLHSFNPPALISSHTEYCIPVLRYPIQTYLTLLSRPAFLAASIPALPSPGVLARNQRSRIRVVRPIHNQCDYLPKGSSCSVPIEKYLLSVDQI